MTSAPERPAAKQLPITRTYHGDTVTDEYAWLADKENPETIAYLEAENAYTEALTAGQAGLRTAIFAEIKGRTQETDLSVPARKGGWWYYSRTADGSPLDGEEILLDANELAGDRPFFSMGAYSVSTDGTKLAFSTDYSGDERFTLRIKDLVTGEIAADEIPDTYYGPAWSRDASALFYVTVDEAWRPYRIWRHLIGTPAEQDQIVFTETDERFFAGVTLTPRGRYLTMG